MNINLTSIPEEIESKFPEFAHLTHIFDFHFNEINQFNIRFKAKRSSSAGQNEELENQFSLEKFYELKEIVDDYRKKIETFHEEFRQKFNIISDSNPNWGKRRVKDIIAQSNSIRISDSLKEYKFFDLYRFKDFEKLTLDLTTKKNVRISQLRNLPSTLKEFNIFSSNIINIENIHNLINLETLNLSYNKIQILNNFGSFMNLKSLHLNYNCIKTIEKTGNLPNLRQLYLSANCINKIQNLENLQNLKELSLWGNNINKIENLSNLINLETLQLGKNEIIKIENLNNLINLQILDLGQNKISIIENLDKLINLQTLVLHTNKIVKIENLDKLTNLIDLNLNDNYHIKIIENLQKLTKLKAIRLERNIINVLPDPSLFQNYEHHCEIHICTNNLNSEEIRGSEKEKYKNVSFYFE